jgi:hypothetical protein
VFHFVRLAVVITCYIWHMIRVNGRVAADSRHLDGRLAGGAA